MPFCPQCGSEYEEGIKFCPDCEKKLTADPPKHPVETEAGWPPAEPEISNAGEAMEEPLIVIYEAPDEFMSRAIRDTLEEAGLPVMEQVERSPKAFDSLPLTFSGRYSRLLVLESCAEEAREIVADFLSAYNRGDLALPVEDGEEIVDIESEEEQ